MTKDKSDALFTLIHRMSKAEKRQFKLLAGQSGKIDELKFVKLFDRIAQQEVYDESAILRREPAITARQMPNLKYFLYDYLLQSLQQQHHAVSVDVQLLQLLGGARVLYEKCLYTDCLRSIDRARRLAAQHHRYLLLPELLDLEKQALRHTVTTGHRERVQLVVQQSATAAESINRIGRYTSLIVQLDTYYMKTGFIRNRAELDEVTRFFRKHLPVVKANALPPAERQYHYLALTNYYFFTQDFKAGYRSAKRWVQVYDAHPELIRAYTELYIRALNTLLVAQNKLGLVDELEQTHRQLVALKRNKQVAQTENIQLNLFRTIYIHEINRQFMRGQFRAGIRIVARLEGELNRFVPLLDHHSVVLFYYKIACLYVGADQYQRALHWLNRIIREKDNTVREDLHGFARILVLICHHELGQDELAEHHLRALYRFLLTKGHLSAYHRLIFKFLRQLHRRMTRRQLQALFETLRTKLVQLQSKRFEKRAFHYFDILAWLDSKLQQRPVEEVIRKRIEAR